MDINSIWNWIVADWAHILAAAVLVINGLNMLVSAGLIFWPASPFLLRARILLADLSNRLPSKSTFARLRAPILALAVLAAASSAQAQYISSGPSLSFFEVRPSNPHPVEVAAGAGYQLSIGWFQTAILGESYDLLDIGGTVYGSAISTAAGVSAGSLSAALFLGTLNELVGAGIGVDLLNFAGGPSLLASPAGIQPYFCFLLNLQRIELGPWSPPVGMAPGAAGLRRGLTTYLQF